MLKLETNIIYEKPKMHFEKKKESFRGQDLGGWFTTFNIDFPISNFLERAVALVKN